MAALLLVAFAALKACVVGPNFTPPEPPMVASFGEEQPSAGEPGVTRDELRQKADVPETLIAAWWRTIWVGDARCHDSAGDCWQP